MSAASSQNVGGSLPHDPPEVAAALSLRDGTRLYLRGIRPDDAPRLQLFHTHLSRKSVFFRFCGLMPELGDELARRLSLVDYDDRMGMVVTRGAGPEEPIIAVARYERRAPEVAEFALAVEDRWQGHGVGPRLLSALAAYARDRGVTTLLAEVLYDNDRMLAMLRHCGFPITYQFHDGRVLARLSLSG